MDLDGAIGAALRRAAALRGDLRHAANLVEAGLAGLVAEPASARAVAPVWVELRGDGPWLTVEDGSAGGEGRVGAPLSDAPATLAMLAAEGVDRVDLVLAGDAAFDLRVELPDAALGELSAMIENEILVESPFDAEQARWIWVADRAGAGWSVAAAIALAERVDGAVAAIHGAGLRIGAVRRVGDRGGVGWAARPDWAEPPGRPRGRLARALALPAWATGAIAASALFVLSAVLAMGVLFVQGSALSEEVAEGRALLAAASLRATNERRIASEEARSIVRLSLPGRIAAALPDDTWLDRVEIGEESVEVSGFSPSAAETVEQLARIEHFGAVRFAAPVARDNRRKIERFRLVAELLAEPAGAAR